MIICDANTLRVEFSPARGWSLDNYHLFLRTKLIPEARIDFHRPTRTYTVSAPARFARVLGVQAPAPAFEPLPMAGFLFDYQRAFVTRALDAKRFALWEDCGLGKTLQEAEFARHVLQS
jgi:hypothetical protein